MKPKTISLKIKNLIKIGERIIHTNMPDDSKHQIILSKIHPLIELIIKNKHEDNAHIERESILAISKKSYWIPFCRRIIIRLLSKCIKCKIKRAMPRLTLMGNLRKDVVSTVKLKTVSGYLTRPSSTIAIFEAING